MQKVHVGVLRGGPSGEYDTSLKTGGIVIQHIPQETYDVQDILISKEGIWHKNGLPVSPHDAVSRVDVVFNALHGYYGADGKVQHLLELYGVPFTGSLSLASALGMNKALSREVFRREGIKTPYYKILDENSRDSLSDLFKAFSPPIVIKPASGGSSFGVALVKTPESLLEAIIKAFQHDTTIIMEEYIPGVEASVGVIDGYRESEMYALPAVEMRPQANIVPGNFSQENKAELEELAKKVHKALGLRHYSQTDFIVSPRRGIFIIETNTLPGLADESLLPKALEAVGASMSHFLDHVIQLALEGK